MGQNSCLEVANELIQLKNLYHTNTSSNSQREIDYLSCKKHRSWYLKGLKKTTGAGESWKDSHVSLRKVMILANVDRLFESQDCEAVIILWIAERCFCWEQSGSLHNRPIIQMKLGYHALDHKWRQGEVKENHTSRKEANTWSNWLCKSVSGKDLMPIIVTLTSKYLNKDSEYQWIEDRRGRWYSEVFEEQRMGWYGTLSRLLKKFLSNMYRHCC